MPQVGENNEALASTAGYVYTGSLWVPLKADASGQLAVGMIADQNVQARAHGYFNAAWQKQPLQFGFGAALGQSVVSTDLAAGTNTFNLAAVDANTVFVVTNVAMFYSGTVTNVYIESKLVISSTAYSIWLQKAPVSASWYDRQGWWILNAGDNLRFVVDGATLHDDFTGWITGFTFTTNL
jgi:hypothetical protein